MNVVDDVIAQGHALLLRLFKLLSSVCRMIWLFSFSARSYVDERSYATRVSKSDIEGQKASLPQLPFCTHRGGALTASRTSVPRNRPERETVRVRNQEKPREVESHQNMPLVSHEVVEARGALYSRRSFVRRPLQPVICSVLGYGCGNKECKDVPTLSKLPLRRRSAMLPSTETSAPNDNSRKRLTAIPKTNHK